MTVLEAQAAVKKHLQTMLSDVEVQVTLADSVASEVASATGPAQYLYDGKPFDYWRDLWKGELSTERRVQAIDALSAFGRAGQAREAAEAILEVATQYDFSQGDNKLQKAVIGALAEGRHPPIPADVWLPIVIERMNKPDAKDAAQWKKLLSALVWRIKDPSAEVRKLLYPLVDDPQLADLVTNELINRADALNDQDVADFTRAGLKDKNRKLTVLKKIGFRQIDKAPEQMDVLFDSDPLVQQRAREILAYNNPEPQPELVKKLLAVLDDPKRPADHIAALRALSAYRRQLNTVGMDEEQRLVFDRLRKVIADGPSEQLPSAIAALTAINSNLKFGNELHSGQSYPNASSLEEGTINNLGSVELKPDRHKQVHAAEDAARKEYQQILPRHPGVERAD
jgi:hypothetical protein